MSQIRHYLYWLGVSVIFLKSPYMNTGAVPWNRSYPFLTSPFLFMIHNHSSHLKLNNFCNWYSAPRQPLNWQSLSHWLNLMPLALLAGHSSHYCCQYFTMLLHSHVCMKKVDVYIKKTLITKACLQYKQKPWSKTLCCFSMWKDDLAVQLKQWKPTNVHTVP